MKRLNASPIPHSMASVVAGGTLLLTLPLTAIAQNSNRLVPQPLPPTVALASAAVRPNVLFIAVDDLKPTLGCYGDALAQTPHMDRLAARGTIFDRAYCQMAICGPTRASLLTGLRPDTTQIYNLTTHFREKLPDVVTLPQQFKNNGYFTRGLSKVFHIDDPQSWSVPTPKHKPYLEWGAPGKAIIAQLRHEAEAKGQKLTARGPAWEAVENAQDGDFIDGETADKAIEILREHATKKDTPFFLATGFLRPHLPWVAPKKYFDLYNPKDIPLPAAYSEAPEKSVQDSVAAAFHTSPEIRPYYGVPQKGTFTEEQTRDAIRGYYASTSYVDAQIGRVLDELDVLGLRDNTIVILWGDHGWHLGDHGIWGKMTNFEEATRVPLIMSVPGQKTRGGVAKGLVELVDVFPTLCEATAVPPVPALEGKSFLAQVNNPAAPGKAGAYSQSHARGVMGYSLRTERFRYTEWGTQGIELYNEQLDPGETVNLAHNPAYQDQITALARQLHANIPASQRRPATP